MSALLAAASATFAYQGASVTLSCGSPDELKNALATFGIGAANDTPAAAPAAQGDAGNGASTAQAQAGSSQGQAPAAGASADEPVTFEQVKKEFLALAAKANGRTLCEEINKKFGVAKLSDNKPENYAAVLAEIRAKAKG